MKLNYILFGLGLGLISCESELGEKSYLGQSNENKAEQISTHDTGKKAELKGALNCNGRYGKNPQDLFDAIVSSPHDGLLNLKSNEQTQVGYNYVRESFGFSYDDLLSDFVGFYAGIPKSKREDLICWTRYLARELDPEKCFDFGIIKEAYEQTEKSIEDNYSENIIKQRVRTARNLSTLFGINTMNLEKNLLDVAYEDALENQDDFNKLNFARYLAEGTGVDVSIHENQINP